MTLAEPQNENKPNTSLLIRWAIWIAIGALIAAALVCVVWVLIGDQQGLIGRAFLTIVLLAAFAGVAILEAGLAPNRPDWLSLLSMITWIVALLVGAVKIWLPFDAGRYGYGDNAAERFFHLILVVGILQLALLHVRLFLKASQRYVTTFTKVITYVTFAFLALLVGTLVFYLTFPHTFHYSDMFWRIVVALTILTAVGTTLIPLLNALFAPKAPRPAAPAFTAPAVPQAPQAWPTYADGITPLPVLRDGSPDWNAYYTGVPTVEGVAVAPQPYAAPGAAPVSAPGASIPDAPGAPQAPSAPEAPQAPSAPEVPATPDAPPASPEQGPPPFPPAPPAAPAPPQ